MPEDAGEAPPAVELPEGPVRYAWFGGILDGRRGDDRRLQEAVARGNGLGLARLDLDVDGGRFSLLFDESSVPGGKLTPAKSEELIEVLNDVVGASADPSGVESTLRCTEVYDDVAVDTLFTPIGGRIECVSRPRPIQAEDRLHAPDPHPGELVRLPRVGRRQALGLLALVLVAFGLLAWQRGLVDRIAARSADALTVDTGPFGATLAVEVVSRWGSYRVTVRRGADWPADPAARALVDGARDAEELAAARAVADGREIWVQLRDGEGRVLEAERIELARLLRDAAGEGEADRDGPSVQVRLHGRMAARSIALSLDSGRPAR